MRVLNASQMREADRRTIEDIGLPSIVLMENAGRQTVAAMEAHFDDLAVRQVAVLCGQGSNGGDGFVVARTLHQREVEVTVFLLGRVGAVRGDARTNLQVLGAVGVPVVEVRGEQDWELHFSHIARHDIVVDALFGTGLRAPLSGLFETVAGDVNGSGLPVVAVDVPSGLSADSHEIIGPVVDAVMTVTMAAPKIPLILPPAETHAGDLVVADIGIPAAVIDNLEGPWLEMLTRDAVRPLIPPRPADAHKGDFGRVLVVAGSRGKTGAAHLAAMAALRSGAGLVTVATPRSCLQTVASLGAEYMTEALDETVAGTVDASAVDQVLDEVADVLAVGPGLGRGPGVTAFVRGVLDRAGVPLVLDADALNALADDPDRLRGRDGLDVVVTPHPGEMARLTGLRVEEVQANRVDVARQFAASHHLHVVLKGHRTVVAAPSGRTFVNLTGNPGLATAGTGDVLTGMVAAWLGQLLDAESACRLAVYLHGAAGDLADADEGQTGLVAGDLVARLGDAVLELIASPRDAAQGPT